MIIKVTVRGWRMRMKTKTGKKEKRGKTIGLDSKGQNGGWRGSVERKKSQKENKNKMP